MSFAPTARIHLNIGQNMTAINQHVKSMNYAINQIKIINNDQASSPEKMVKNRVDKKNYYIKFLDNLSIKTNDIVKETNDLVHKMNSMGGNTDVEKKEIKKHNERWGGTYNNWFVFNEKFNNEMSSMYSGMPYPDVIGTSTPHPEVIYDSNMYQNVTENVTDRMIGTLMNFLNNLNILKDKESSMSSFSTKSNDMITSFSPSVVMNNKF